MWERDNWHTDSSNFLGTIRTAGAVHTAFPRWRVGTRKKPKAYTEFCHELLKPIAN
jgi:hypothetical protein